MQILQPWQAAGMTLLRKIRWIAVSILLPLLFAGGAYVIARRPKPEYKFTRRTTVVTSEKAIFTVYHAPLPIYPPQALRDRIEGSVKFKCTIAADGSIAQAEFLSGPAPLVAAALAAVRQYQLDPKAGEADIEIPFSLADPTLAYSPPELRDRPAPGRAAAKSVRVVATVNKEGRVDSVQPLTDSPAFVKTGIDIVLHWTFRPALRNGQPVDATLVLDIPVG